MALCRLLLSQICPGELYPRQLVAYLNLIRKRDTLVFYQYVYGNVFIVEFEIIRRYGNDEYDL